MEKFNRIGDGLFIAPQPTEQDLLEAKRSGVRTVIDMRMPDETPTPNAAQVRRIGLDYSPFGQQGNEVVTERDCLFTRIECRVVRFG